ncbi:hypothetical protein NE562_11535 [Butyricicoccus faecihominis]|uniref:DUF6673 family protein n=1 Tax=Butyricicoccus faecihominis TaxID=1712515 RepID=UPI002479C524|nr:DUF6673 family protein [Butyricicoccus faecihominis]MCQ5130295.1 hypothetical protein [Butyricicoccus faecihominis]
MNIQTNLILPVERNGKPVGELVFDPSNTDFRRSFYALQGKFKQRQEKYIADAQKIPQSDGAAFIDLEEKICKDIYTDIDDLFGNGTSEMVFCNTFSLDVVFQFLYEVQTCVSAEQEKKLAKYTNVTKVLRK